MNTIDKLNLVGKERILQIKETRCGTEMEDLDFKEVFHISEARDKVEFVKDIAAFNNTKGGYLIFGVSNSFEWKGLDERSSARIDDADISNVVDSYLSNHVDFVSNVVEIEGNSFLVIYVFQAESINPFKKEGSYMKKRWGGTKSEQVVVFKNGDVYCRRGSRSMKADALFYSQKKVNFRIIENVQSQSKMYNEFVGRETQLDDLYEKVTNNNNRVIQVDGIGGIGKTAFVHYFCSKLITGDFKSDFQFIVWTSAKQDRFSPDGIRVIKEYVSNCDDLFESIVDFLKDKKILDDLDDEMDSQLLADRFLSDNRVLLIIDNLETLNDQKLIDYLGHFPSRSKALLTTRETLGDFYMARINLMGFEPVREFPCFLNSQYKWFANSEVLFSSTISEKDMSKLYSLTKGMPLACQLIVHQVSRGTPVPVIISNLKRGNAYDTILSFCFKGSIDKLTDEEKTLLYLLSLPEKDNILSSSDIEYITGFSADNIGINIIPKLQKISLCYSVPTKNNEVGYSIPHLAKIYARRLLKLPNEDEIIKKYEQFCQERTEFASLPSSQLVRTNAKNHKEIAAANEALAALSFAGINYDTAVSRIESLIEANPGFAFLYLIRGKIEDYSDYVDKYEKARESFKCAISIDEDYLEAILELAYHELKHNKKNNLELKKVIELFNKAQKLDPENVRVFLGIGQAYALIARNCVPAKKRENAELADNYFKKAFYQEEQLSMVQKHSNAIAAYSRAQNLKNIGNIKGAIKVCENGLSYDTNDRKLLLLLDNLKRRENPNYVVEGFQGKGWKVIHNE